MRALHALLVGTTLLAGAARLAADDPPAPPDVPKADPPPPEGPKAEPPPAEPPKDDGPKPDAPKDGAMEAAREAKIKELKRDIRRWAQGPYAAKHKDDLLQALGALATLGGLDAAKAALEALPDTDPDVRDRAFALVEKVHDKALVAPLAALIEHKDLRRDWDLHRRIAHALTVTADVAAIPPLTLLISSEDEKVVAQAADGLATFGEAKVDEKREAVQKQIDLYESTWNLMNSVRAEDQKLAKIMNAKWDVYGAPVRKSLQALTGQPLSKPKDWRRWWNDHKKDAKWIPGTATPEGDGPPTRR